MSETADDAESWAYVIPAGPGVYVATLRDALPLLSPTGSTTTSTPSSDTY